MSKIRCSLSFHTSTVNDFPEFAGGVRDGIYGNPTAFVSPPILETDFQAALDDYNNNRYAYVQGGLAQKGPYLQSKEDLMVILDTTAEYVDTIANGNANIITLAGYVPTKGNISEQPAPTEPEGIVVKRGSTGQILAECENQSVATAYGCIMTANEPLPANVIMNGKGQLVVSESGDPTAPDDTAISASDGQISGTFDLTQGRKKSFINLNPGTFYYFRFYASNSRGVSGLSESVGIMCA